MKIFRLETNPTIYSGNSYLILGDWNKLDDVNALVDTGSDAFIQAHIRRINTGVGKVQVNKILLTHNHFDHIGGANPLQTLYGCDIFSYTKFENNIKIVRDGETLRLGDSYFDVIHTPGHSSDSVCFYNKSEGILFSGDTQIRVISADASYTPEFVNTIKRLSELKIKIIYPGHGDPIIENPEIILQNSLRNVEVSKIYCPRLMGEAYRSASMKKFN